MKNIFLLLFLFSASVSFSQMDISNSIVAQPTCFGFPSGSIIVNIIGGTAPYESYITNSQGDTLNSTGGNVANFLFGGIYYYITVIDNGGNGDTLNDSLFLGQPPLISFNASVTQPLSSPSLGNIDLEVIDAVYPIYLAATPAALPPQNLSSPSTVNYTNLAPDIYNFQTVDDNGCTHDTTITINYLSTPISFNLQINQPFTNNPTNGSITIQNIQGNISPISSLQISVVDANMVSYPVNGLICDNLPPNSYAITIADSAYSKSTTENAIMEFQDLSIGEQPLNDFIISNISEGTISLKGLQSSDECFLFNAAGQKIKEFKGTDDELLLELTEGLYVLSVSRNGKLLTRKFISQ